MIGGAKGIGIGIDFGIPNQYCRATNKPYIEKDVLDSLRVVASAYGKSNDDADRSIVKNLVDASNPFIISNAAFKLNSGFGEYKEDFTSWRIYPNIKVTDNVITTNGNFNSTWFIYKHSSESKINEMNIKVSGIPKGGKILYFYISDETANLPILYTIPKDGIYHLPESKINNNRASVGFTVESSYDWNNIRIEQIPSFEGAFVTDGIDDLITSTKTVQEMGITDEITVVSMIHKISSDNNWTNLIGELKEDHTFVANRATNTNKTGIYGYTYNYVGDAIVINNILGDKNDYIVRTSTSLGLDNKYYVTGFRSAGIIQNISQIAWYWTFIANRVLTEDEINLVIEKYNLDRPGEIVKPQVYYNIKKQKISNDNHSAFDDKLIDYSGNGYDAKLYNFGWKEDSGIGKYETDFTDWKKSFKVTSFDSESIKFTSDVSWVLLYHPSSIGEDIPSFKVRIKLYGKGTLYYNYITQEGKYTNVAVKSEIFETPICYNTKYTGEKGVNVGFTLGVISGECSGTITQIPEYENALVLDGVDDYGKVTGLPILKDYTVAADYIRTFAKESAQDSPILSKSKVAGSGAFLFNYLNADSITSSYSFGTNNILKEINDSERKIYYLSKYASDGHNVNAGSAVDSDTMWLGTYRDNISNFFTGALYFAMLFPYSLSEFLLERQLKKHKLGTLYPNMVEFRPVIKSSVELVNKPSFAIRGTSTLLNAGDYIPENSEIWVVITMNNVADRITKFVINGNTIDIPSSAYNPSTMKYGFPFTIDSKSPQKITMTIEQDENYVKWNPVVESNVEYASISYLLRIPGQGTVIPVIGQYYPILSTDTSLVVYVATNGVDEVANLTINGQEPISSSIHVDGRFKFEFPFNNSPQKINITIDEYIRFEDIVQPYPLFFEFTDENNNLISWGGKAKVGSTITRVKGVNYANLLEGLFTITNPRLNGVALANAEHIVEKSMVFTCTATWAFDNNEPKCILSPRLLSIPNSSYKILGYIPDISGHGNNGVINNSAYAGMSGANGYPNNFNSYTIVSGVTKTDSSIKVEKKLSGSGWFLSIPANMAVASMKLNIDGIPSNKTVKWATNVEGIGDITLINGVNEIPAYTSSSVSGIYTIYSDLTGLSIQQIGEYEGAYCLDGVDDFVTIPTLSSGGKQVLMKVNWDTPNASILYDQRGNNNEFAIYNGTNDSDGNPIPAYQGRNNGQTYIDGILNSNIMASELKAITHNITITNELSLGINNTYPVIGSTRSNTHFAQMSLYDFMLFDEISTDDKIQELNEYVGIEAKVELPPYYWDAYGKTNLDADKATIQQRGVAVGDYDLINNNFAYEGMSGYNGYPVVFGASKTWANESNGYVSSITSNTIHITNVLNAGLALLYSYVKYNGNLQNIKEIPPFKIEIKGLEGRSKFIYKYLATSDATKETNLYLGNGTHELPKSFPPTEALVNDAVVGFSISTIEEGVTNFLSDITIEVLPEYENGLAYDGITDYSKNANIPVLTDYTYIYKRTIINIPTNAATLLKGADKTNGGAFIADYGNKWQFNFGQYNIIQGIADGINWQTVNSFNGTSINKGENTDDSGITVAKFSNGYTSMVFYKLILYPKTISLLEINFLKNLMEKDEIIDLTNPIFIQ